MKAAVILAAIGALNLFTLRPNLEWNADCRNSLSIRALNDYADLSDSARHASLLLAKQLNGGDVPIVLGSGLGQSGGCHFPQTLLFGEPDAFALTNLDRLSPPLFPSSPTPAIGSSFATPEPSPSPILGNQSESLFATITTIITSAEAAFIELNNQEQESVRQAIGAAVIATVTVVVQNTGDAEADDLRVAVGEAFRMQGESRQGATESSSLAEGEQQVFTFVNGPPATARFHLSNVKVTDETRTYPVDTSTILWLGIILAGVFWLPWVAWDFVVLVATSRRSPRSLA